MTVEQWADAYAQAWRDRDADAAAKLFTDDCLYRAHPLQDAHLGVEGVRAYWSSVTSTQDAVDVRMGRPIESADGRRAAVEFGVRMLNGGAEVTLIGILFLRFAENGRCEDLRETWLFEPGDHAPHEGWGTGARPGRTSTESRDSTRDSGETKARRKFTDTFPSPALRSITEDDSSFDRSERSCQEPCCSQSSRYSFSSPPPLAPTRRTSS
jgi:hypothetical protein